MEIKQHLSSTLLNLLAGALLVLFAFCNLNPRLGDCAHSHHRPPTVAVRGT